MTHPAILTAERTGHGPNDQPPKVEGPPDGFMSIKAYYDRRRAETKALLESKEGAK